MENIQNLVIFLGEIVGESTDDAKFIQPTREIYQHTNPIIERFNNVTNTTTLTASAARDTKVLSLVSVTGVSVGSHIILFSTANNQFMTASVVSIDTLNITLDRPLDSDYPSGSNVDIAITNMNVNGLSTPVIFGLRGTGIPTGIQKTVEITRIIMMCQTTGVGDLSEFGDIAVLTNGLQMRKRNDTWKNVFNVKTNGEIVGTGFDYDPYQATNPIQGINGFGARITFGGDEKMGTIFELPLGEDVEFLVQDDLTAILKLEITAEGRESLL